MDDAGVVLIAVSVFGSLASIAYALNVILRAWVARHFEMGAVKETAAPLLEARMNRLEAAVDTIAIEVERISEGQRFTTKLLSEQGHGALHATKRERSSDTSS